MAVPTFIGPGFTILFVYIFLLGIGTTFLQVSGNPIMRDVSDEGKYSRIFALAQGLKELAFRISIFGKPCTNPSNICNNGMTRSFSGIFILYGFSLRICGWIKN
jgi:hypothetical protein